MAAVRDEAAALEGPDGPETRPEPAPGKELRGRLGLETARIPQQDRHGLLWLGRGQLYVHEGTLRFRCAGTVDLDAGDYAIPFQLLTCLVLEPGTSVTHDVLRLCAAHGTGIVAVGEGGTRCFASAPFGPNESARARRHARLWADEAKRLAIARRMFAWRLGEVFPGAEIAVLRGMEGSRMKETYKRLAEQYRIAWRGRRYDRANPEAADVANQAINHVVTAVEATAMVAVAVTGAIPQLGFIHEEAGRAFTLDITDLYRDTVTLPVAFTAARELEKKPDETIERIARRLAAKTLRQKRIVLGMIDRIKEILDQGANTTEEASP
ncbi:MAG: type I-E CRISPR-associated endonuclease Cas1 [Deltaproteobacteria bacterium]|nr:type I-E CRISPR-associated endonuclease Cas1 [Deltaproteobacteria bacterium]